MSQGIAGKVVVITGASSELGEAAARRLGAHGARLALGARRAERLEGLGGELRAHGAEGARGDHRRHRHEEVKRLVDAAVQASGA